MKGKKHIIIIVCFFVLGFIYRYSPWRVEFLGDYEKVIAHRVNSLEKQETALKYFNGIELDLIYKKDKGVLDVNHPPTTSINLNFETYLNTIDKDLHPFLWLDIKDLNTSNKGEIFLKLNTLFESRNYPKDRILIETQHPVALKEFTNAGYLTCYYLPGTIYKENLNERDKTLAKIKDVLKEQPNIGISFNSEGYELILKHFPEKDKYVWNITSAYIPRFKKVKQLLNDSTVKIIISQFNVLSGDR